MFFICALKHPSMVTNFSVLQHLPSIDSMLLKKKESVLQNVRRGEIFSQTRRAYTELHQEATTTNTATYKHTGWE